MKTYDLKIRTMGKTPHSDWFFAIPEDCVDSFADQWSYLLHGTDVQLVEKREHGTEEEFMKFVIWLCSNKDKVDYIDTEIV